MPCNVTHMSGAQSTCKDKTWAHACAWHVQVLSAVDKEQLYGAPEYKVFEL